MTRPESRPSPTDKELGAPERQRRQRLRWMAAEVSRVQEELRSLRAALDSVVAAEQQGSLSLEQRTQRRDLSLQAQALRLRLQELHAEFETLRASAAPAHQSPSPSTALLVPQTS